MLESLLEGQRLEMLERRERADRRHAVPFGTGAAGHARNDRPSLVRLPRAANDLRAGTIWYSLAGADPFRDYISRLHAMFQEFTRTIEAEVPIRLASAAASGVDPRQRSATWTT
jgi:hypothetical protein